MKRGMPVLLNVAISVFVITVFFGEGVIAQDDLGFTYYVDSENGDDNVNGLSPETAWQTIAKVNSIDFNPGDSILFRRGGVWREQLIPKTGNETGHILYGAYGTGEKPLLLGSKEINDALSWIHEEGNIWTTKSKHDVGVVGDELISNPSFDTNTEGWSLYDEGSALVEGARDIVEYDSSPASYSIFCESGGDKPSDIQFYTHGLHVIEGNCYKLSFRAKSSEEFGIDTIQLMKTTSPWNIYYSLNIGGSPTITNGWGTHDVLFVSNANASDGRLTLYLGKGLPAGATLNIDSLSFKQCEVTDFDEITFGSDVGNLILNNEALTGIKVWNESDLDQQGEFWYDEENELLKMHSVNNPGEYYSDIECVLNKPIIHQGNRSYVIYENLDLRYGNSGIAGGNTHHIIVRDCDISFIGGGDQYGGNATVRCGNGIEFWNDAHDNLVERNRIYEIYDAALTNQGTGQNSQYNIVYRNNIIWNSEYCFEYWNRPETSITENIHFENNICYMSGHGWGHNQRPGPNGRHLMFYSNLADTGDFYVRNNIFYESTESAIRLWKVWNGLENLILDNNIYFEESGDLAEWQETIYSFEEFLDYKSDTGQDLNSTAQDPFFVDPESKDFHLQPDSPAIDAGTDVGLTRDFDGNPVPLGLAPDIGAFEHLPQASHRADTDHDGCIVMSELMTFIDFWKMDSTAYTMPELMVAIGLWKAGTGC